MSVSNRPGGVFATTAALGRYEALKYSILEVIHGTDAGDFGFGVVSKGADKRWR
ncbi:hypothetical protein PPTG_22890 [Phytophthora nicotianae INRA-310]|uniref:Uncharacterized protein n=1 Tax=Phytophthora nicotianae (strain INRA-310) TaxID=761204 RepID=W2QAG1_PHYN3|nr:hypothetical protein PPTG_22890 [Phytophthora nicotianae INRA-310]ETN09534.1 hypothetical protein PPTG_22890 [Phytophthora nicotianae INRA-310]